MAGAGCRLLANPVARSAMLLGALAGVRYWWGLLGEIRRELRALRPAVVVPIDSSAVNLRVAQVAGGGDTGVLLRGAAALGEPAVADGDGAGGDGYVVLRAAV